ncbi:MAG: glycosyltransferase [Halochromatium sp.]|uniref:glycosyltransferase n=1 Tax=Halochromatium sp. TaxID=2049430 RepID=UPI00397ABA3A
MKASIVIPTLNEAELLPRLLDRLAAQSFRDFEVIVADAGSHDGTRELVRERGLLLTDGGLPGVGRNRGAAIARGDLLFFFDADVLPPPDFLAKAIAEMEAEGIRLATCWFEPDSDHPLDVLLFDLANLYVKLSLRTDPHAGGFAIFIERALFERIGGFDERLKLAEDHELVKRAATQAPLHLLHSTRIRMNVRRLVKDGRVNYAGKCLRVELYRLFHGEATEAVVDYRFGYDAEHQRGQQNPVLTQLRQGLADWNQDYTDTLERLSQEVRQTTGLQDEQLRKLRERFDAIKEKVRSQLFG